MCDVSQHCDMKANINSTNSMVTKFWNCSYLTPSTRIVFSIRYKDEKMISQTSIRYDNTKKDLTNGFTENLIHFGF